MLLSMQLKALVVIYWSRRSTKLQGFTTARSGEKSATGQSIIMIMNIDSCSCHGLISIHQDNALEDISEAERLKWVN